MSIEHPTDFEGTELTTTDDEERGLRLALAGESETDEVTALASMYDRFSTSDRAQGVPPVSVDRCASWVEQVLDGGVNVVAWHDDRAVGHAALLDEPDEHGHELAVFVDPDYRGAGVGTVLLYTVLEHARRRDVERVFLSVERANRAALALYRQFDFEVVRDGNLEVEMAYTP